MTIDPRTPVLVGVGQAKGGDTEPAQAADPIDLWAESARAAEADSGAAILPRVELIAAVMMGSSREPDPGRALAGVLGIDPGRTLLSGIGGNTPQRLVNDIGESIRRGELDVALIGGAECLSVRRKRRAAGLDDWPLRTSEPCPERVSDDRPGSSEQMDAHGLSAPLHVYPLFESALRIAHGETVDEHLVHISDLWAELAAVAARNPYAWSDRSPSAKEIRTPSADNRLVCWPYTKLMCARVLVDQAAALLLTSYEAARDAGVSSDRIVFLHAGADGHDHWFPTERERLAESPGMRIVGGDALDGAGIGADDIARFDLYSCFPSAVQMATDAYGISADDPRPLSVTGGLTFAGGPLNNFVTHSIASMAQACREDPGSRGLTTAIGWYATKHSAGVWSTDPPATGSFQRAAPDATQTKIDALPARTEAGPYDGRAVIEATAVSIERDGSPNQLMMTALTADGRRVIAASADVDVARDAMAGPLEGTTVEFRSDGPRTLLSA